MAGERNRGISIEGGKKEGKERDTEREDSNEIYDIDIDFSLF